MRRPRRIVGLTALALVSCVGAARADADWTPVREDWQVRIVTQDEDGATRDLPIWAVVLEGDAVYVRTNQSRWLANLRRGSAVTLKVRDVEIPVTSSEVADAATKARVEEAFKTKYGWMQRMMSALRTREPTVLKLEAR